MMRKKRYTWIYTPQNIEVGLDDLGDCLPPEWFYDLLRVAPKRQYKNHSHKLSALISEEWHNIVMSFKHIFQRRYQMTKKLPKLSKHSALSQAYSGTHFYLSPSLLCVSILSTGQRPPCVILPSFGNNIKFIGLCFCILQVQLLDLFHSSINFTSRRDLGMGKLQAATEGKKICGGVGWSERIDKPQIRWILKV